MNNGKEICKRLKKIRREIAEANGIALAQKACTHQGDCMGTCPRCEQEVQYLTSEIERRRQLGKAVKIIGVAAVSGSLALASCNKTATQEDACGEEVEMLEGDVEFPIEATAADSVSDAEAATCEKTGEATASPIEIVAVGEIVEGEANTPLFDDEIKEGKTNE
ncbi:MAG: hypothetical protein J6Y77_07980 [Paludibacteraceae bacterium]|nr:hypothetical protein [Paludibacteraceae bacterium]